MTEKRVGYFNAETGESLGQNWSSVQTSLTRNRQEGERKKSSTKTFSKVVSAPTSKPPTPTPPSLPANAAQIRHNPGAISQESLIQAQQNFKPVEDIITTQVVGSNIPTGEAIVQDGGGNKYNVKVGVATLQSEIYPGGKGFRGPAIIPGQQVIIARSRSQSGERTVRLVAVVPLGQNPSDFTASLGANQNINDLCKPASGGGSSSIVRRPPDPPEGPDDNQDPNPPIPPEPPEDEPEDEDPPSRPFGCNPNDNARWYNGSCPAGMRSLGTATLSDGSTKSLCTGPNLPPGDGCPETPDTYGWSCVNGVCQQVPNGLYATRSECEGSCQPEEDEPLDPNDPEAPLRFNCVPGSGCEASPTGVYSTLEECESACVTSWNPPSGGVGPCVPVIGPGGAFVNEADCSQSTGQCPNRRYFLSMNATWELVDIFTGVVTPMSWTNQQPNFANPVFGVPFRGPVGSPQVSYVRNSFFAFQENQSFNIVVNMADGQYRWFTGGNSTQQVRNLQFSITTIVANPEIPCN